MSQERKKRILIADDEEPVVRIVTVNLELEGYEVIPAYDGAEAWEKIKSEKPDLAILDIMMPEMDGWEVLEKIRSDPELKDMPVIMLTALAQAPDISRSWEMGAESHLTKPFDPLELITLVRRLLKVKEEGSAEEK